MNVETPRKFTAKAFPWIWFSFSISSFFSVCVFIQSSSLFYLASKALKYYILVEI
ncbi:hypothetical protein NC653_002108 [Populus alba x Populus x berolinensis]|uniref:Uncharacterized protein n=1 Tax=Populus alba x Populus x berolinensis TaxID=444605 RepID=A0AAD6RMW1_9ROSI|nr:hypothetical protein NC653_002108 [Populus alba x Populus x berolinensis]